MSQVHQEKDYQKENQKNNNNNIKHNDYNNKIRTTNILKMNTGLDLKVEIIGNSPRKWYPFVIDPQKNDGGKYICKFDDDVIGQIEGGGDSGDSGGGDGGCCCGSGWVGDIELGPSPSSFAGG